MTEFYTIDAVITVRFQVEGWHHWPDAPEHRAYLGRDHRHMFHVEVSVPVAEDDREIEFHDLLDFARIRFGGGQMGGQSCEMMARDLCRRVTVRYDRPATVRVFEDGEVGATVSSLPKGLDLVPPTSWRAIGTEEAAE